MIEGIDRNLESVTYKRFDMELKSSTLWNSDSLLRDMEIIYLYSVE